MDDQQPTKYSKSGLATIFLLLLGTTVFLPIWGEDGMILFFIIPALFMVLVLAVFFFVIFLVKSNNKTPYLLFIIPLMALYAYTFVNVMYLGGDKVETSFLYADQDYCNRDGRENSYQVVDGRLIEMANQCGNSKQSINLYWYDNGKNKEISYEAAKKMQMDVSPKSDDGYEVIFKKKTSFSCFIRENSCWDTYIQTNEGDEIQINANISDGSRSNFYFLGWVEETPGTSGDIIGSIILSDLPPDDCNEPMGVMRSADAGHAVVMLDGNVSFWGDAYVAVEVDGALSDGLQVQWFTGEIEVNPQSQDDFAIPGPMDRYVKKWNLHSTEEDVTISKACNGKSYAHFMTPSLESGFGVTGTWLEPRKVVVLLDGKVVGEQEFYFQQ